MGVDPGLAATGWGAVRAVGRRLEHVAAGVIVTSPRMPHLQRLQQLGEGARRAAEQCQADFICVERVFMNINPKTSLALGEARGATLMALSALGKPVVELTALQIKRSLTGGGRAGKKEVAASVGRLLQISTNNMRHDAADALACALAALLGGVGGEAATAQAGGAGGAPLVFRRGRRRR